MATFKVETKNKVDIDKKPRVYFTCHPDDFERYFKKICDDIFKTHDCAIYYTEDMTENIADGEKEVDLGRNNLFIIPVTFKLLTSSNRAMDEDIPYALKEHIPVLPIMMEPGIDEFYSKPDKFGELQYLNPYSTDLTEISYEEKLKKYLESVLISDELAKRVRAAFDAYIFLSYRKKDRKYANELMRLIHSNPECRDIAIWFDEFLTPGESFKENIEKILDDCKLFTLLVTPQLLEKVVDENGEERDNYVISTELPLARKKKEEKGTDIFAVEMENTDREALSAISIEDYTNPENADFRTRLMENISRMAITTNNTPEHNFLIGLAYLEGIDVEVDRERAIELIMYAAKNGQIDAMEKLRDIYSNGLYGKYDYFEASVWGKQIVDYYTEEFGISDNNTLSALHKLSIIYDELCDYTKALQIDKFLYKIKFENLGEYHPDTLCLLNDIAVSYLGMKEYNKAKEICEEVYKKRCEVLGQNHLHSIISLLNIGIAHNDLKEYEEALNIKLKAYKCACLALGAEHPQTLLILNSISVTYLEIEEYDKAIEWAKKAVHIHNAIYGEHSPCSIIALSHLADIFGEMKDYSNALKCYEKVYYLSCTVLGENHPNTLTFLENWALYYKDSKNNNMAIELLEKAYDMYQKETKTSKKLSVLGTLVELYTDNKKLMRALNLAIKSYDLHCKYYGKTHPETLMSLISLSKAYSNIGNHSKALSIIGPYKKHIKNLSHINN